MTKRTKFDELNDTDLDNVNGGRATDTDGGGGIFNNGGILNLNATSEPKALTRVLIGEDGRDII